MYQNIFFFVSNKKTHTNKMQKKVKKIEKQKIPKKKRRKKMLPKSLEKQTGYIDIVWQFALCKERTRAKNNKLWQTFVCICLLFVEDENKDMLMQYKHLSLYILCTLVFQLLILKWLNFLPRRFLRQHFGKSEKVFFSVLRFLRCAIWL